MRDYPTSATKVLMLHPRFVGASFWNYRDTCELLGAEYPAPPLGLITVAALLPAEWDVRLVDMNLHSADEALREGLAWADLVMIGGMLPQRPHHQELIETAQSAGKPVLVGGPDVTSCPEAYAAADFRLEGEAEGSMDQFVAAWEQGARSGLFQTPKMSVDLTQTPIPRYELLDLDKYLLVNVQFSRGCPFLCEFCDIIELFGRKPRTKTTPQLLAELDRLHELGYRGHVDFVDDNLIGNKKAIKLFLPDLIAWQKERGFPFQLTTEASLNLADDADLLGLMRDANFYGVFVGIESPDPEVLIQTKKKQNINRDIAESVHRIQAFGIFVLAGFIVGFDSEKNGVGDALINLIEEAAIPVSMIGLLYALPNTQLTRRLEKEGRLHPMPERLEDGLSADACTSGLNFDTLRPRADVLRDFRKVVDEVYRPDAYFERVKRAVDHLDCSGENGKIHWPRIGREIWQMSQLLWGVSTRRPDMRGPMWRLIWHMLRNRPTTLGHGLTMIALYAHLGPFSRFVLEGVDMLIEQAEAEAPQPAPLATSAA